MRTLYDGAMNRGCWPSGLGMYGLLLLGCGSCKQTPATVLDMSLLVIHEPSITQCVVYTKELRQYNERSESEHDDG